MNSRRIQLFSIAWILIASVRLQADDVDDFVRALMEQRHIPAISIAVVKDGRVIKAGAFEIISNRADGYVWSNDKFTNAEDWTTVRPSGAFLSTAGDMAKWEVALQTDRILTRETKKQMWTPVKLNNGSDYPYGFGWELDYFPNGVGPTDVPIVRHEGTIPGFRAAFWRIQVQNITVIVMSNLDRAALDQICAGIAVRYVPELLPAYHKRWP